MLEIQLNWKAIKWKICFLLEKTFNIIVMKLPSYKNSKFSFFSKFSEVGELIIIKFFLILLKNLYS